MVSVESLNIIKKITKTRFIVQRTDRPAKLQKLSHESKSVVLNIPAGKTFINGEVVSQSSQKGPTCSYYAFNFIRSRIGSKLGDKLEELFKEDKQLSALQTKALERLLEYRKKEKATSLLRKKRTSLHDRKGQLKNYADSVKFILEVMDGVEYKTVSKDMIDKYMLMSKVCKKEACLHSKKDFLALANKFKKQDKFGDLESFISNNYIFDEMNLLKSYINSLGMINNYYEEIIKVYGPRTTYAKLADKLKYVSLSSFVEKIAARNYGFEYSSWCPSYGVNALKKDISNRGAIVFGGYYGSSYYDSGPLKGNGIKDRNYEVYFWKRGAASYENSTAGAHAIAVIGIEANKVKTKDGKIKIQDTVLFIDPNDSSSLKNPRKVYRLSYNSFVERLLSVHGQTFAFKRTTSVNSRGPFGYCKNNKLEKSLQADYKAVSAVSSQQRSKCSIS